MLISFACCGLMQLLKFAINFKCIWKNGLSSSNSCSFSCLSYLLFPSFDLLWNENVPGLYVQLLVNHYNQTFDYYHGDPKIFFFVFTSLFCHLLGGNTACLCLRWEQNLWCFRMGHLSGMWLKFFCMDMHAQRFLYFEIPYYCFASFLQFHASLSGQTAQIDMN